MLSGPQIWDRFRLPGINNGESVLGVARQYSQTSVNGRPDRGKDAEQKKRMGMRESGSYERNESEEIEDDGPSRLRRETWPRKTFDGRAQKGMFVICMSRC